MRPKDKGSTCQECGKVVHRKLISYRGKKVCEACFREFKELEKLTRRS